MNFNNTVLTLGLVAAFLQMPATSFAQGSGANRSNPLLQKSSLPFGAPDFSKIQETDYLPAIKAAIKNQRENIQKIVDNKKKPTFQNTILAYEESGIMLDRVINVFDGLTSAHKTPVIAETEDKVMPLSPNSTMKYHSISVSSSASSTYTTTSTASSRAKTSVLPKSSTRASYVRALCFLPTRWNA